LTKSSSQSVETGSEYFFDERKCWQHCSIIANIKPLARYRTPYRLNKRNDTSHLVSNIHGIALDLDSQFFILNTERRHSG